jgi:hypothetical protein
MMSATQMNARVSRQATSEARAGAVALVVLRLTLLAVALALVGTVAHVTLKLIQG